jgi:hypothetical protein
MMSEQSEMFQRQLFICDDETKEVEIINLNTSENINIISKSGYFQAKIEWMNASNENPILKVSVPLDVSVAESVTMFKILMSDNLPLCEELLEVVPIKSLVAFFDFFLVESWKTILDDFFLEELNNGKIQSFRGCIDYVYNLYRINQKGSWFEVFQDMYRIDFLTFIDEKNGSLLKPNDLKKKMRDIHRYKEYKKNIIVTCCKVCNRNIHYRFDKSNIINYISRTPCCHQILHRHCVSVYLFHKRHPQVYCTYCQTPIRNGMPDIAEETLHSCLLRQKLRREANVDDSPLTFPMLDYDGPSFPFFFKPAI